MKNRFGFDFSEYLTPKQISSYEYEIIHCFPDLHLRYRTWCEGCKVYQDEMCPIKFKMNELC